MILLIILFSWCFFIPRFILFTFIIQQVIYIILCIIVINIYKLQSILFINTILFILAWILQFIGHRIEKLKPAFLEDIKMLLVGPVFILTEVILILGWFKQSNLQSKIDSQALKYR